MKALLEVIKLSADWLSKKGVSSPRLEAEWGIASVLGLKRLDLYLDAERPLSEIETAQIRQFLERRGKREPLQYIFNKVEFLDCTLKVTPAVLIPRPETEILADKIIKSIENPENKVLWDVCCGSGCLGISIKKKFPTLTVIMSDLSPEACEIARENAKNNGVEIEVVQGDLLDPFKGQKAHYVVSNPPYISKQEFEDLEPEVKDFEPVSALVSGDTGLEFYERFANELPSRLFSNSKVWFELGPEGAQKLFKAPEWTNIEVESDWAGLPRFLLLNFKEDFRILSR